MARTAAIPVIYTEMTKEFTHPCPGQIPDASDLGPRERTVVSILPQPGDLVIRKHKNSAFFGTLLASHLIEMGVDTLISCGCATSACVRATVTDAAAYSFHVMLVEECTFDKRPTVHKVNMFDINNRFGEVVNLAAVSQYLEGIRSAYYQ